MTDRIDGVINLDKPPGISSARAVDRVKRLLPPRTKIGHAGTLDPFATGVLLLLVGKATKSCEQLMGELKTYLATIKLGATTATDDPESHEQACENPVVPTNAQIQQLLPRFQGEIEQRPPNYSAIKLAGRPAYDRARSGETLSLKPRKIHIYAIELLDYAWPLLKLRVDCGRGTYIRSIARDLGEALNVGGYLTELRRTRIGAYHVDKAFSLNQLNAENIRECIFPIEQHRRHE